jgi:glycerol-3-phosphate dehydrogenase (NAD(P)+)
MKKVAVIGNGGYGTALSIRLATNGHQPILWGVSEETVNEIRAINENVTYLPGVKIPESVQHTHDPETAVADADLVVLACPSKFFSSVCDTFAPFIDPQVDVVSIAKGLDETTLKRMTEVAEEKLKHPNVAAMSGPNHAEEVARGIPSALVAACRDPDCAKRIQAIFNGPGFRVYTSDDVVGVEIGGAVKNVIALAAGVSDGIGFGDNTKAALLTRGLAEITRIGVKMGANPHTFSGLSGMGDLVVTCASKHSRNRSVGERLGKGENIKDILDSMEMVAEGVWTCETTKRLTEKLSIEAPITEEVYAIIHGDKDPKQAVIDLLNRDPRHERDEK